MNYLTNLMTEFLLISSVATPMVLVVFLLKPINSRFQTLKWQNLILKLTLVLFFLPVYSLFGEISLPEKTVETQKPVVTVPFVPNVIETPELFSDVTETEETGVNFIDYLPILSVFWIIGVILSIFFQSYCYRKFKNSIKSAKQTEDETLLAMLSSEREKLGIRKNIPLYTSHHVVSPMVSGVFSSKIYIPEENKVEKHVLTHELIHFKNKDLWWKALLLVGKVLHWYNPFIYLLGQELEENLEFCCDLEVIEQLDVEEKKEYALTILSTYEKGTLYGLGLNHRPKQLERRVKFMFEKKKKSVVVASFTGLTLLFVLGMASTMANQSELEKGLGTKDSFSDDKIGLEVSIRDPDMTEQEKIKMYELERKVAELMLTEFSVEAVATLMTSVTYAGELKLSICIDNSNLTNLLDKEKILELVTPMLSDWNTDRIDISYTVPLEEMPIIGEGQWDESQKNPFVLGDGVFIGGTDFSNVEGVYIDLYHPETGELKTFGEYADYHNEQLGSLEDDEGFKYFEAYHPETGELMTPTEWGLYYDPIREENEANPSHYSRGSDETYEIEEGIFTHNGKTYPYKVTATRLMEEGEWELVVYTSDPEISFAEIMMAGVGLSSGISDYKYFQSRAVLVRSLDAENS
ncbi:MAG: M56 family metallopeptidase [Eubacteriales bacterium]